jgi:tRNA dimethylallyltransferase
MDRELLNKQINKRVDVMMERGLLDEVNSLVKYNQLQALQTVGYAELFNYIEGCNTLEEAVEQIKQNTRKYGKRQVTWFKKNKAITWFPVAHIEKIISFIETSISESQ